jgi:hypothetical protein
MSAKHIASYFSLSLRFADARVLKCVAQNGWLVTEALALHAALLPTIATETIADYDSLFRN